MTASEFSAGDPEHAALLTQMGIQIQTMTDGRKKIISFSFEIYLFYLGVQLIHNIANAASNEDANDGLIFIQDMMELMKNTDGMGYSSSETNHHLPLTVIPLTNSPLVRFPVGPAQFGKQLHGKLGVNKYFIIT